MTETSEEFRRRIEETDSKYYEQIAKRADPYKVRSFEYEKLAADFANKGFQSLTYLNGGALVAIPTAMAFFNADVGRVDILWTAVAFVAGLLFVVAAQIAAFFVMSKRAESSQFAWSEQWQRVAANQFPYPSAERTAREAEAKADRDNASSRTTHSNFWRYIGLMFFFFSFAAFVAG